MLEQNLAFANWHVGEVIFASELAKRGTGEWKRLSPKTYTEEHLENTKSSEYTKS